MASCGDIELGGTSSQSLSSARLTQAVTVADNSVVVSGPDGYCIDRSSSRLGGDTPFVLLGSCSSLAGSPSVPGPLNPGLLSATVSKGGSAQAFVETPAGVLRAFFESNNGRALLARDGDPASVSIIDVTSRNGVLMLYVKDQSTNITGGLASDYWRGLFEVNGRLVTTSVFEFSDVPLTSEEMLAILFAFSERIKRSSPNIAAQAKQ